MNRGNAPLCSCTGAGAQRGLQIRAQREDIFNAMHRI